MSERNRSYILSVPARLLLAVVLAFGQTAWAAQGQNAKDKPSSNAAAKSKQAPANSSTVAEAKSQSAEEKTATEENPSKQEESHPGGPHEGIKVHGHWTVEVRNRDGSLARHLEFENSLAPPMSLPNQSGQIQQFPGGAALLSAALTNQWNVAPNWNVLLVGPSGLSKVFTATDSPCPLGACNITVGCAPSAGVSCNLSVTPLGTTPNFTGIQMSGSVVATQVGQISTVATSAFAVCPASTPNCVPNGSIGPFFTISSNFPGAPIGVSAGQTIAVTVTISFS